MAVLSNVLILCWSGLAVVRLMGACVAVVMEVGVGNVPLYSRIK